MITAQATRDVLEKAMWS